MDNRVRDGYNERDAERIGETDFDPPERRNMKEPLNHQPQTGTPDPAHWEETLRRFEKMTKERPLFNGLLTFFLLLPLVNLLVRLIAGLPIDTWHYAEAFLFLLPIGAIWA